jgi:UDPglucose 6-dehydrogenase
MINKTNIGIIGLGFVGNAIKVNMEGYANIFVVDNDPIKNTSSIQDLHKCEGIFVCVPTPQGIDGSCDYSILESVLEQLTDYNGVIISKCTAPPDVYARLGKKYKNLVHAPEFLTAANAVNDYKNSKFTIVGGTVTAYQNEAARLINIRQVNVENVYFCTLEEASLTKYAINTFLATKVAFMNEIYQLTTVSNIDYTRISSMMMADSRIGESHMQVPGPDGALGFGGMCFPKDTAALLKYSDAQGKYMNILDAAVKKNTLLRLTSPK